MKNIPTAEEFVMKGHLRVEDDEQKDSLAKSHIEFAKLHVEAALKEASEEFDSKTYSEFVLNAYPLTNIK